MSADSLAELDGYLPLSIGSATSKVTGNPCAQRWYDRGCAWCANFHREEAAFCFTKGIAEDAGCAMAHWMLALCNGPDYNFSEKGGFYQMARQDSAYPSFKVAVDATEAGRACERTPVEVALLDAMALRVEWPVTDETPQRQVAYSKAMAEVAAAFPHMIEAQLAHAESLMCLSPWDLYEKSDPEANTPNWYSADLKLKPIGREIKQAISRAQTINPAHIWAAHLLVHLNEMGPADEFDWPSAERLRAQDGRGLGHLRHMPTHLDIQALLIAYIH